MAVPVAPQPGASNNLQPYHFMGPYYSTIIPNPACRVEDIIGRTTIVVRVG